MACCPAPIAASSPSTSCPTWPAKFRWRCSTSCRKATCRSRAIPCASELDVALVFSANPEDYTARGKIVTPLKDRIGSEIRTHYPETLEEGMAITAQEAWANAARVKIEIPEYVREIVEQVAFSAREDKKVDKRSGVSQRLPISTMELVVSNAERRALLNGESLVVPRVSDIYAAAAGHHRKAGAGIRRRDARRRYRGATI